MEKKEYVKPETNVLTLWMFLEKHKIWLYDYLKEDTKLKVYLDKYNQICKDLENTSEEELEKLKIEKEKLWNQILIMILSQISQGNKSTSESGSSEIKNVESNSESSEVKSLFEKFSNLNQLDKEKAIKNLDENDLENFIRKIRDWEEWSQIYEFCFQECEIRWMWRFILDNYSMWYFSSLITKKELYDKISNIKILDWITESEDTTELILDYLPLFVWEIDLKNWINELSPTVINNIWRTYGIVSYQESFKYDIPNFELLWSSINEKLELVKGFFEKYFIVNEMLQIAPRKELKLNYGQFISDEYWCCYMFKKNSLFVWNKTEGLEQYNWVYIERGEVFSPPNEELCFDVSNASINMSDTSVINKRNRFWRFYYNRRTKQWRSLTENW